MQPILQFDWLSYLQYISSYTVSTKKQDDATKAKNFQTGKKENVWLRIIKTEKMLRNVLYKSAKYIQYKKGTNARKISKEIWKPCEPWVNYSLPARTETKHS